MRRCECGNTRFHAHQRVYMDILVDANNNFRTMKQRMRLPVFTMQKGHMALTLARSVDDPMSPWKS